MHRPCRWLFIIRFMQAICTWCRVVQSNWDRQRLRVTSPKTEHHPGGASRLIPIFPELLAPLREVFDQAEAGSVHIITRYRKSTVNIRTQLQRNLKRAGLTAWPKLWQNLRATRATELADKYPAHVAAAWCGHAERVAIEHYWQVTEDHFEAAIRVDRTEASAEPDDTCTEASGTCPQSGASGGGTRRQVVTETAITALSGGEGPEKWAIQDSNL